MCTPSHSVQGGAENILEALRRGLPERGFDVVFGLARGRVFHDPRRYAAAFPGLCAIELDGRSGTRTGRLSSLRRVLAAVKPDVVLVSRLFDALHAACVSKAEGRPWRVAVTVFGNEPEYLFDLARYGACVDLCVTDGRLTADAVRRLTALPAERVRAIPGPVSEPPGARPGGAPASLRLGYVGRIDNVQKRAIDLVDTLVHLRRAGVPFTCRVAGAGPAEAELRRRLAAAGLMDVVRLEGWLGQEQLQREFYPNLDVLLHFAAWEGNPITPREALAHGVVPVISRFTGCVAEGVFLHEQTALLFEVGDCATAARWVGRLHADPGLRARLSENGRRCQREGFSEQALLDAWAGALAATLDAPARRGAPPTVAGSGRLERLGLPAALVEVVRRVRPRPFANDPGGEWPHWSGDASQAELAALREQVAAIEAELDAVPLAPT